MEKLSRNEYRTLVVVYKLAGGSTEVSVLEEDIIKEINKHHIYDMTDQEFTTYHSNILAEIKRNLN